MESQYPKPREKTGSQCTELQQQRALARWEGEGGASSTGSQASSLHADDRVSLSLTKTTIEISASHRGDERQ